MPSLPTLYADIHRLYSIIQSKEDLCFCLSGIIFIVLKCDILSSIGISTHMVFTVETARVHASLLLKGMCSSISYILSCTIKEQ